MTDVPLSNATPPPADAGDVTDQWSAVINIHGGNLAQIESTLAANVHEFDPHPSGDGRRVRRHPVYLVAEDYTNLDGEGRPSPGQPLELDLQATRDIFSKRYDWVSAEPPPADGSYVRVAGAHYIAEKDSAGNATGRVVLGNREG
jgi:hypothetical protein